MLSFLFLALFISAKKLPVVKILRNFISIIHPICFRYFNNLLYVINFLLYILFYSESYSILQAFSYRSRKMKDRAGQPRERKVILRSSAMDYYYVAIAQVSARKQAHTHIHTRTHTRTPRNIYTYIYVYIRLLAIRSVNIMRATRWVITLFRYTIDLCNCTSVLSLYLSR